MDGKLRTIHRAWIPAIYAGMTVFGKAYLKSDKVELGRHAIKLAQRLALFFPFF